eukprot:4246780-Alexandrium_andersonii.AAC.1
MEQKGLTRECLEFNKGSIGAQRGLNRELVGAQWGLPRGKRQETIGAQSGLDEDCTGNQQARDGTC